MKSQQYFITFLTWEVFSLCCRVRKGSRTDATVTTNTEFRSSFRYICLKAAEKSERVSGNSIPEAESVVLPDLQITQ